MVIISFKFIRLIETIEESREYVKDKLN